MGKADFDVAIVGAGFAGMYMLHRLRGLGLSAQVIEAGSGVGGTWYWNRYPGARCDVESMEYSYQFSDELQQEWSWSERYAAQPEILRYANHVADRLDLRSHIRFDARVVSAVLDETDGLWRLRTEDGTLTTARYCVMATGCLSAPNTPAFQGTESFKGPIYHTGTWPHGGVDFTGLRVGVIGTGSSAVQSIPIIARQAKQLIVFQRTPNYVVPAHNRATDPAVEAAVKADYAALREKARRTHSGIAFDFNDKGAFEVSEDERRAEYERRWQRGGLSFMGAFNDLLLDEKANATAAQFVREKIRERVQDPQVAEALSPSNVIGCKRLCIDIGYFETFNKANVQLVDVAQAPIERITERGVRVGGETFEVDALVFATGFDAMTGALQRIDIRGTGGRSLKEKWHGGPRAYLGLSTAGFPNFFMITGPGSPSVLTNMLPSIEQHVEWICDLVAFAQRKGTPRIEPQQAAEDAWVEHVNEVAGNSLRSTCSSWYVGANVPGKPRVFMPYIGGFPAYVKRCQEIAAKGYEGFSLS